MTTYTEISRAIRGLKEFEQESILPNDFAGAFDRFVRIYKKGRPLLAALATIPIFPPSWRFALDVLIKALDAVVAAAGSGDGVPSNFKAGRDL